MLFAVGNRALVYYFEVTQLTSAFGATAGFAAIMVWMYWTSLTILIGAQVGRVDARRVRCRGTDVSSRRSGKIEHARGRAL